MQPSAADRAVEAALFGRIRDGDTAAFEQLYEIYYSRLYRFIFRITRSVEDIQEVINDTMFVVWSKAHTFRGTSALSTWIFGIAMRKSKASLSNSYKHEHGDPHGHIDEAGDNNAWHDNLEIRDWLENAMEGLSHDQRAVVELTYYEGLHYRDIAEILGCPENTVKTRMFYARAKLKEALNRSVSEGRPGMPGRND